MPRAVDGIEELDMAALKTALEREADRAQTRQLLAKIIGPVTVIAIRRELA